MSQDIGYTSVQFTKSSGEQFFFSLLIVTAYKTVNNVIIYLIR